MSRRFCFPLLCSCLLLVAGCGGDGGTSVSPEEHWSAVGDLNSMVNALTVYGGDLIAGGYFTEAGGVTVNHVARWDGTSWHALGDGVSGYEAGGVDISFVSALTVYKGNLIVGGYFNNAGEDSAYRIARWDGSSWSALGSGIPDDALLHGPHCLAVYDGDLIVGGRFHDAGGVSVNHIAGWDGASWYALGTGVSGTGFTDVSSACVYGDDLIIGGSFDHAGGSPASYIARWDGASWGTVGSGVNGQISCVCGHDGYVVAGGTFSTAGGVAASCIGSWNGTSWTALGSGMSGGYMDLTYVMAVLAYNEGLVAGGNFTNAGGTTVRCIAFWDGSSWDNLGSGVGDGLYGMTDVRAAVVYDGDLIVGGNFTSAGGQGVGFIAKWAR